VCRGRGKPVQIHHIDDDPSNNSPNNLAVLCFDCHRDTQIRGGFDRKLDSDQIVLYRDDWHRFVAVERAGAISSSQDQSGNDREQLEWITSTAEIYRDNGEFELLAIFYDSIRNAELRDKYIEIALQKDPSDQTVIFLRSLQGKVELIPESAIEREAARYTKNKDWSQRARFFYSLGKYREAALDYVKSVKRSLEEERVFGAAFYLKELVERGLIQELFIHAFAQAKSENNLWWQVRALQELDWHDELSQLLIENSKIIEQSEDLHLLELLAYARGDQREALEIHKTIVRGSHVVIEGSNSPSKLRRGTRPDSRGRGRKGQGSPRSD
jgi:hypothetical protein